MYFPSPRQHLLTTPVNHKVGYYLSQSVAATLPGCNVVAYLCLYALPLAIMAGNRAEEGCKFGLLLWESLHTSQPHLFAHVTKGKTSEISGY